MTDEQTRTEWAAWAEVHRCAICNALPVRMETNTVDEYRTLKPEYRYLAAIPVPAEPWQTNLIGGEYIIEIQCENGHVFAGRDYRFIGGRA